MLLLSIAGLVRLVVFWRGVQKNNGAAVSVSRSGEGVGTKQEDACHTVQVPCCCCCWWWWWRRRRGVSSCLSYMFDARSLFTGSDGCRIGFRYSCDCCFLCKHCETFQQTNNKQKITQFTMNLTWSLSSELKFNEDAITYPTVPPKRIVATTLELRDKAQ